jgi:hypothetical protein
VDIDACTELVRPIARMTPGIGGFSGLLALDNHGHHFIALSSIFGKKKLKNGRGEDLSPCCVI